jgi:hypothetical protein
MFPHGAKAISIPVRQKAAFNVCYWLISAASQSYPWRAASESCGFHRFRPGLDPIYPRPSGRKQAGPTKITTLVVESMEAVA